MRGYVERLPLRSCPQGAPRAMGKSSTSAASGKKPSAEVVALEQNRAKLECKVELLATMVAMKDESLRAADERARALKWAALGEATGDEAALARVACELRNACHGWAGRAPASGDLNAAAAPSGLVAMPRRRVAAAPRPGDVATPRRRVAAACLFRGGESRRRRGQDVAIPWRRVAAAPRRRDVVIPWRRVATAAGTWLFRGDESRRCRGAGTWLFCGDESRRRPGRRYSAEASRGGGRGA